MNLKERLSLAICIEAMEHAVKVFRSLSERGKYPQELCPFDLSGKSIEVPQLFLGVQGFINLIRAIDTAKECLEEDTKCQQQENGKA